MRIAEIQADRAENMLKGKSGEGDMKRGWFQTKKERQMDLG